MNSYVIQKQSRGVGAVAAEDLGAVSRASGSPVARCPSGQSWDKIEQMCRPSQTRELLKARLRTTAPTQAKMAPSPIARPSARTLLKARLRTTAPAVPFVQGRTGKILPPPKKPLAPRFLYPKRAFLSTTTPRNTGAAVAELPLVSSPIGTEPAGVLPGAPPATARPVRVASVQTAVAARNQAQDQLFDAGIEEAAFQIPQITEGKGTNKTLIYGGIGLGALALLYLMTRKG